MKKISTIIITHNRYNLLKQCLDSILNQHKYKSDEIIVIDDGSTDQTRATIKNLQKRYKSIKYFYQKHKGYSAARNLGLKNAKGEIIFFTDDDCIVEKGWFRKILKRFEENPSLAAVGGSILPLTDSKISWASYILNFSSWYPQGKTRYVKDIPTTNIAYRKKMIEGLYFPDLPKNVSYEDSLFNFELTKNGKKMLFDPTIKVYHSTHESMDHFLKNQRRHGNDFLFCGYKVHGLLGKLLVKVKFLNLFCPRLLLVGFRCIKTKKMFTQFIRYFPLIFRGELKRGLTIINEKHPSFK